MIVEKLPIKKEWIFQEDDDITITFSMKDNGVLVSLVGGTAFSQIRVGEDAASVLIATGTVTITANVITASFTKASIVPYVGKTIYGNIRFKDSAGKYLTLLKFSAEIESTNTREVV
jgi:hypothetical protein